MLKVYGTMLCKDCVACAERYTQDKIEYEFLDFADNIQNLKEFLKLRDTDKLFDDIRAAGSIGIPCVVTEEGKVTLDWEQFAHADKQGRCFDVNVYGE